MRSDKVDEKIRSRFIEDDVLDEKSQKSPIGSWMSTEGKHHELRRSYERNLTPKEHCHACQENE